MRRRFDFLAMGFGATLGGTTGLATTGLGLAAGRGLGAGAGFAATTGAGLGINATGLPGYAGLGA